MTTETSPAAKRRMSPLLASIHAASNWPVYPAILGAAAILAAFGSTYVAVNGLWRPLIVTVAIGLLLPAISGLLTHRWHASAFLVALAILAVVGLWQLILAAFVIWLVLAWRQARRRAGIGVTPVLTRPLNVIALIWLLIAGWSAVDAAVPPAVPAAHPVRLEPTSDAPNIYLVLLDGYPRADTLMRYFGHDNTPFLADLERRGFEVNENSRSDYGLTLQTVPTMLHMRSAEALGIAPWTGTPESMRRIRELINQGPVVESLEEVGYTTVTLLSPEAALDPRNVDRAWQSSWLVSFEAHLIQEGVLDPVATDFLYAQYRASILDIFAELERTAAEPAERRFVFAHVMSPHAPFAFAADGSPAEPASCEPECGMGATYLSTQLQTTLDELSGRFVGQVEFINRRVLEAVDAVIASDPNAVIVVFSDHGSRLDLNDGPEWLRNLFAARTPGRHDVFAETDTPMSLFAAIFNAYFGADIVVEREADTVP